MILTIFYRYNLEIFSERIQFFLKIPKMHKDDEDYEQKLWFNIGALIFSTVATFLKFHSNRKWLVATMTGNVIISIVTFFLHSVFGQCINVCQIICWILLFYKERMIYERDEI